MNDDPLFIQFCHRHCGRLLSYAKNFGTEEEAHDALQDCLIKFGDRITALLDDSATEAGKEFPDGFLKAIHDAVIDTRRHRYFLKGSEVRMAVTDPTELPAFPTTDTTSKDEMVSAFRVALDDAFTNCDPPLNELERAVIQLTRRQEPPLEDDEAATILEKTEQNIRKIRSRAQRKMAIHLAERGVRRLGDL